MKAEFATEALGDLRDDEHKKEVKAALDELFLNGKEVYKVTISLHGKKATIHQVTTMLATSKNVLFPGHNHLLTTGAGDLTLWLLPEHFVAALYII